MKVVHTKNQITLEMRLKEEADTETIRVEQKTYRIFELKKYKWFWIWDVIATFDTVARIVVVHELIWKEHEDLIRRLTRLFEHQTSKTDPMTIEVYS